MRDVRVWQQRQQRILCLFYHRRLEVIEQVFGSQKLDEMLVYEGLIFMVHRHGAIGPAEGMKVVEKLSVENVPFTQGKPGKFMTEPVSGG